LFLGKIPKLAIELECFEISSEGSLVILLLDLLNSTNHVQHNSLQLDAL
jgi:hypothetical protein